MQIGDIIYLQYDIRNPFEDDCAGFVTGDGISSNKVRMLAFDYKYRENAFSQFRKCLFRIENKQKYSMAEQYQKHLSEKQNMEPLEFNYKLITFEKFMNQEKEEQHHILKKQQGHANVKYGDIIQLKHLYSDTYLSLDYQKSA